jgi:hypothetical protein
MAANPKERITMAANTTTLQVAEHQLQVGDIFTDDRGRQFEVLAWTPRGRSRTQRQLPDGKPYKIAPSWYGKVTVQRELISASDHDASLVAQATDLVAAMQAAQYGTPEARKLAKQAKDMERTCKEWASKLDVEERAAAEAADPDGWSRRRSDRVQALYSASWDLQQTRVQLETVPLPVPTSKLPCRTYGKSLDAYTASKAAPLDTSEYAVGDVVIAWGHGAYRDAMVIAVGKTNLQVAYTTPSAVAYSAKHRGPQAEPPHSRGTHKPSKVYDHRPADRTATHQGRDQLITEALGVAPGETLRIEIDPDTQGAPGNDGSRAARKGATMATSTKKQGTKKATAKGAGRPKAAPMTAAQAKAAVAANKEGALAYMTAREEARQGVQGAAEAQEKHRPAYTLYKRAYGHPSLQQARQKARDKKAAKAPAKSAKPKTPKSEPVVEPVASTEAEVVASGGTEG